MIKTEDGFKLDSTGRTFYAHAHIIGIDEHLKITYGYDGSIDIMDDKGEIERDEDDFYSVIKPEEKKEIAEYMITLWEQFAGIKEKNRQ